MLLSHPIPVWLEKPEAGLRTVLPKYISSRKYAVPLVSSNLVGAVIPIPTLPSDVILTTSARAEAAVFSKENAKSAAALLLAFLIALILAPYLLLSVLVDVFKNIEAPWPTAAAES